MGYSYAEGGGGVLSVMGLGRTDRRGRKASMGRSQRENDGQVKSLPQRHSPHCFSGRNKPGLTCKEEVDNLKLILHIISSFSECKD